MGDQSYLRMARTSGAVGLGFDIEPPSPSNAPKAGGDTGDAAIQALLGGQIKKKPPPKTDVEEFIDDDDVKYETVKDESMGRDQVGLIRAATLERLVERLTHEKISDPKFRRAFLLTYRSFTTPSLLIEALIRRYDPTSLMKNEEVTTKRVRVVGVLKAWMEDHFFDFAEPELQKDLSNFLESMQLTMQGSAKQLTRVFERGQERWEEQQQQHRQEESAAQVLKEDPVTTTLKTQGFIALKDVKVIAEQMTLYESQIYCAILPKECISWNKKEKELLAPNISKMIKQFNQVSGWVTAQLVQQVYKANRIALLKKFIDMMEELQNLNNFNGMMEVLSGINSSSVRRMKKTFAELDADYTKRFEKIEALLSHKLSYKVYREHLHKINPPCVPYLGVYLTDLTFMSDGNPDTVDGGLINFKKRRLIAEVIDEIQQYQVRYFKLEIVPGIRAWLENDLVTMDDDTAYKWSRRVEPKDDEALIAEFLKGEENLRRQIEEYETKAKQLEEEVRKEEEKQGQAA